MHKKYIKKSSRSVNSEPVHKRSRSGSKQKNYGEAITMITGFSPDRVNRSKTVSHANNPPVRIKRSRSKDRKSVGSSNRNRGVPSMKRNSSGKLLRLLSPGRKKKKPEYEYSALGPDPKSGFDEY
eukprot:TRINITY_DN3389_c0_g1_i2.p2 TRINITY_DN3389_c0_g1~~TRINITY_DN3389_c0_g1_i2.p2  ORF type:complete len:125 (-),score=31.34 TRINITY_DN3389_c0_g1_i2:56-430(-)